MALIKLASHEIQETALLIETLIPGTDLTAMKNMAAGVKVWGTLNITKTIKDGEFELTLEIDQ